MSRRQPALAANSPQLYPKPPSQFLSKPSKRGARKLTLEGLLSHLCFHNPAMNYIHTVRTNSTDEFTVLWHLAHEYPRSRSTGALAAETKLSHRTIPQIAAR